MNDIKLVLPMEMSEQIASQIAQLVAINVKEIISRSAEALLPEEDVCRQLKVTKRTMYNFRQKGLRSSKIGKERFYTNSDLLEFHKENVR